MMRWLSDDPTDVVVRSPERRQRRIFSNFADGAVRYSPDQPRDEAGRFGERSGGQGASSLSLPLTVTEDDGKILSYVLSGTRHYAEVRRLKAGGVEIAEHSLPPKLLLPFIDQMAKEHGSVRSAQEESLNPAEEQAWSAHPNVIERGDRFVVDEPVSDPSHLDASMLLTPDATPTVVREGDAGSSSHAAWVSSLTEDERQGLSEWSLGAYTYIRPVQAGRDDPSSLSDAGTRVFSGYQAAMDRAPITEPTMLFRGLYNMPSDFTMSSGDEMIFDADSSTSRSRSVSDLFSTKKTAAGRTAVSIVIDNGRGVDLKSLEARTVSHEQEVVLRRGTKIRVRSVKEGESRTNEGEKIRVLVVHAEQV